MPRRAFLRAALSLAVLGAVPEAGAAPPPALVFCAPGSAGSAEEAQPAMDAFAAAVAAVAGLAPGALAAAYAPGEEAGLARLAAPDAAGALVSLPFFLKHERALRLRAGALAPVLQGGEAAEVWSLVARKGRVPGPAALEGLTILSTAGWAPAFVRGVALGGFGPLPPGARIAPSAAVLSALRRAAAGEPVAVLLDGAQAAALPTLAFAKDLEVVARSRPVPVGVVAAVEGRLPRARWKALEGALRDLARAPGGAEALAGIRLQGFAPLDAPALEAARRAHAAAGEGRP